VHAAPLTDAALTSYHAVKLSLAQLRPGSMVLVLGVGGLGHMAIQIVKAITSAQVLAVDVRPPALELARDAGADAVIAADGLTPSDVRAELGPDGAAVSSGSSPG
jgi:propanol-preferring alcohol dehydrogenase